MALGLVAVQPVRYPSVPMLRLAGVRVKFCATCKGGFLVRFIRKIDYGQDIDLFEHIGQRFWYGVLGLAVLLCPLALDHFLLGSYPSFASTPSPGWG